MVKISSIFVAFLENKDFTKIGKNFIIDLTHFTQ